MNTKENLYLAFALPLSSCVRLWTDCITFLEFGFFLCEVLRGVAIGLS